MLEVYRTLGLEGNDGTGTQPIPTGLWTQVYIRPSSGHVPSESELRLNHFSAWAFGFKLTNAFFYNHRGSGFKPLMFEDDGWTYDPNAARTPQFDQVAETNRQSLNLGPALVRLISTDVQMKMGRHMDGGVVTNELPVGVSSWDFAAGDYITNIEATNLGSKNDGLEGDVIVGYFKPLDASFTDPGYEEDIYFMILNGLSDGTGLASDCSQQIRLDFDFLASGIDSLLRLSRYTGLVEEVALTSRGGSRYYLDLFLEGGTGDLFKFNNGGTFVSETQLLGDANGDGVVNFADYQILEGQFGSSGAGPYAADFNNDNDVDFADYQLLEGNFGAHLPEPATLLLTLVAAGVLALRRKRISERGRIGHGV